MINHKWLTLPLVSFFLLIISGCNLLQNQPPLEDPKPPPEIQLDYAKEGFLLELPNGWRSLTTAEIQTLGTTIASPASLEDRNFYVFTTQESGEMIGLSISPGPIDISSKSLHTSEYLEALPAIEKELAEKKISVQSIEIFDSPALQGALVTTPDDSVLFITRHRGKEYTFTTKVASRAALIDILTSLRWTQPIFSTNDYSDPEGFFTIGLPPDWSMVEHDNFPSDIETTFSSSTSPNPLLKISISENQYEPENFAIFNLPPADQKNYLTKEIVRLEKSYEIQGYSLRQAGNSIGLYSFAQDPNSNNIHLLYLTYHKGRYVLIRLKLDSKLPSEFNDLNAYFVYQIRIFNDSLDSLEFH